MSFRFDLSTVLIGSGMFAGSLWALPSFGTPVKGPMSRTPAECLRFVDSAYERSRAAAAKTHTKFEFSLAQKTEKKDALQ